MTTSPLIIDSANLPTVLPNPPLLTSYQSGWNGIHLAHHRQPSLDLPEMASPQHTVIIPLGHQAVEGELISEGRIHTISYQEQDYVNGCIEIFPANLPYKLHATTDGQELEFIHCYLEPTFLAHIAHESVNPARVELTLEIKKVDSLIHQIGLALRANLEMDGIGSRFYADSMATALSAHLLRHYSTRNHDFHNYDDGLSQQKLGQAIDYIHEHLGQNLSLFEIANALDMSQYYFCRLFKQSTGISPHQYLLQQRIERAKQLLKHPELTIIEVALASGFSHQSHFAKVFRKRTGFTPNQFRKL